MDKAEHIERYEQWSHTASLSALIANCNRDKKKKPKPYTVEDFMPITLDMNKTPSKPKKKQTWQEQLLIVKMFNAALGGKVVEK